MLNFLRHNAEKMLFAFGVAMAIFAYGVAAAKYDLFPHRTLQSAFAAARDWQENWRHYLGIRSNWVQDSPRQGGVTIHDRERAWAGQTFVSLYRNGSFGSVLIDMDGKILHEWSLPLPEKCPKCGEPDGLVACGPGVERIAEEVGAHRGGRLALVRPMAIITQDVPPFWVVQSRNSAAAVNVVGMRRSGMSRDEIKAVRAAYRVIFDRATPMADNIERAREEFAASALAMSLVDFLSVRGRRYFITPPVRGDSGADDGDDASE